MSNIKKLLTIGLSIFILCLIGMIFWYFSLHKYQKFNFNDILKIITKIGLISAIIPSILIFLMYYLKKKMTNTSILIILIIQLLLLLIFSFFRLSLVMTFYNVNDSKSFLQTLMGIF